MKTVKWGIIGCGDVTEVKSGPAFRKVANSELVAVMRRNAEKASDYARRHHVPKWYANADELINDSEVNAIYVATPPDTHAFYAKQAINAGKAVYIEKPMCRTFGECEEVNRLAQEKDVPVFVAYYRRSLAGFLKVAQLIKENAIGDIRMVNIELFKSTEVKKGEIPWRVVPEIAGGGLFYDLASHQIDFLNYLFGAPKQVKSIIDNQSKAYDAEDILSVSMKYDKEIIFNGGWCFNSHAINDRDTMTFYGTKGRITCATFEFEPIKLYTESGMVSFNFAKPEHVQYNMINHVVSCLVNGDAPISTGTSGAITNQIMELILNEN